VGYVDGNERIKKWGARGQEFFLKLQIRVAPLEHCPEFLLQCFHPRLQQEMRTAPGPLHLLLLAETPADDLATHPMTVRLDAEPSCPYDTPRLAFLDVRRPEAPSRSPPPRPRDAVGSGARMQQSLRD